MNVTEACQTRISVRAFKPDPVPEATARAILEVASRDAASGGNLQPWRIYAFAGDRLRPSRRKSRPGASRAQNTPFIPLTCGTLTDRGGSHAGKISTRL